MGTRVLSYAFAIKMYKILLLHFKARAGETGFMYLSLSRRADVLVLRHRSPAPRSTKSRRILLPLDRSLRCFIDILIRQAQQLI